MPNFPNIILLRKIVCLNGWFILFYDTEATRASGGYTETGLAEKRCDWETAGRDYNAYGEVPGVATTRRRS